MGLINKNKPVENDNPIPIRLIVQPELEQIWFQIAKCILLIFVLLVCFVMHDHRNIIDTSDYFQHKHVSFYFKSFLRILSYAQRPSPFVDTLLNNTHAPRRKNKKKISH
jgi:hypothetical protein